MANGDTKTEALLNILGNGGDSSAYRGCCNTKTQSYILDAIDRVESVEEEVEELKNNPDVVDIVATYADLQAYDTSKLTDKDVIRVLTDSTHDNNSTYYRYSKSSNSFTYIGTSKTYSNFVGTDGTAAGVSGLVPAPATTDAGKYLSASGVWEAVQGGGGGVTTLSQSDYNYDSTGQGGTPDSIALWLLDSGVYQVPEGVAWVQTPDDYIQTSPLTLIIPEDYTNAPVGSPVKIFYMLTADPGVKLQAIELRGGPGQWYWENTYPYITWSDLDSIRWDLEEELGTRDFSEDFQFQPNTPDLYNYDGRKGQKGIWTELLSQSGIRYALYTCLGKNGNGQMIWIQTATGQY